MDSYATHTIESTETLERPPDEHQGIPKVKVYAPLSFPVLALIMPGAVFGTLARLGLTALATYDGASVFPLAYAQAVGCLVMGVALRLRRPLGQFHSPLYTALTTGFCGSLTTFSSWQFEVWSAWTNADNSRRGGLGNAVDGIGLTVYTLSICAAAFLFGQHVISLLLATFGQFGTVQAPSRFVRHTLVILSVLTYAGTFPAYFLMSSRFRSQATAALLFSYPGALTRYLLAIQLNLRIKAFPLGTFTANVLGTALVGIFHVLQNKPVDPLTPTACRTMQGLIDGYCGCLTTISTFIAELYELNGWRSFLYAFLSWGISQLTSELESRTPITSPTLQYSFTMSVHQTPSQQPSQDMLEGEVDVDGAIEGDELMEDVEEQEDGYTSSTPTSTLTWISWFCSLPGHEYFCEVTEDFIEDDFNLTGLNTMVPFWKEAMEMVLDVEPDEEAGKIPDVSIVESSAEMLYGLVHQRYILTRMGLQAMLEKYETGVFGSCPRVYCDGCNVVPCGRSDTPGLDTVKLYCPNCNDIYVPPSSRYQGVDGAFFGTTFAHLFFQSYRELAPAPFWKPPSSGGSSLSPRSVSSNNSQSSRQTSFENPNPYGGQKRASGYVYIPRIYGFKVSERAKSGPRMQWLRLRPESPSELDSVDWRGRWLDDDDEDFEDEELEDEDKQMEDFDPDANDGDEEEEEEEEETLPEPDSRATGQRRGHQHSTAILTRIFSARYSRNFSEGGVGGLEGWNTQRQVAVDA
ncbi:hypothetical protein APHAL10511_001902 [Amanita phalloides]|nr:hypothetical protein APHAL10511_001902 [Amanita phalloides]